MKVTSKKTGTYAVRLSVNATAREVGQALEGAKVTFAQNMGLKPDANKSVSQVAFEQMGIKDLDPLVSRSAVDALVPLAIDKAHIVPAYMPKPEYSESLVRNKPFSFTLNVALKQPYELNSYDPVSLSVPPFTFDEGSVDRQIKVMKERDKDFKATEEERKNVRDALYAQAQDAYERELLSMVSMQLSLRFEGKIPDDVFLAMREAIVANMRLDAQHAGVRFEDIVRNSGGEQQFNVMVMLQARQMLAQSYALEAIYRHEKLSLTDEDLERACLEMNPGIDPKISRMYLEQTGRGFAMRETAERIKANRWALEHANLKELDLGTSEEPAAEKAPADKKEPTAEKAPADKKEPAAEKAPAAGKPAAKKASAPKKSAPKKQAE